MNEAGAVIGRDGKVLHWHLPPDRNVRALPDSRTLWDVLWEHRARILGFAHSHPGSGCPVPSWTDRTTFAAIEAALGRRLVWWITSTNRVVAVGWRGPDPHDYAVRPLDDAGLGWLCDLREHSER